MEVDLSVDDCASQTSSTSTSSMAIQFSMDELQENNLELVAAPSAETVRSEGKIRRMNRRLALASLQLPKLTANQNDVIDLCTEEDKMDLSWLKKKFPSIKTDVARTENIITHSSVNAPASIAKQRCLKQSLEKKLAERRRAGLAKRKELYMEDNEGVLEEEEEEEEDDDDDDEEEEDNDEERSSKPKKKVKEREGNDEDNDDDYSADDEEEQPKGEEPSEGEGADKTNEQMMCGTSDGLPESLDLFDGGCIADSSIKDESVHKEEPVFSCHHGAANESCKPSEPSSQFTFGGTLHPVDSLDLMLEEDGDAESTGMTQPQFPNSLSQWFGEKSTGESSDEAPQPSTHIPQFVNVGTFSDMDPFKDSCDDDILMLCSGRFDSQNLAKPAKSTVEEPANDSHEELNQITAYQKRKRLLIESDEEEELDAGDESEEIFGKKGELEPVTSDIEENTHFDTEKGKYSKLKEEVEEEAEEVEEDDDVEEDEEEEELDIERKDEDCFEKEADSDDELAVVRRLEKSEFERKANRENWFDDEASLSGDDVGSDLDEDLDAPNEYEAEEGDNDDVPDSDVIRRQNHKLLLKQEKDREHKELVKLQDRLLADGDLGGTETNRTFRLKLREDVTIVDGVEGEEELPEEEQDVEASHIQARRVEAIKWLIEQESHKDGDDKEEDDIFDIAARSVHISKEVTVNVVSKVPRSLLGQPSLANAIKEVGAPTAKQLYVNNSVLDRKRSSSPTLQPPKKSRATIVSLLSVLEPP